MSAPIGRVVRTFTPRAPAGVRAGRAETITETSMTRVKLFAPVLAGLLALGSAATADDKKAPAGDDKHAAMSAECAKACDGLRTELRRVRGPLREDDRRREQAPPDDPQDLLGLRRVVPGRVVRGGEAGAVLRHRVCRVRRRLQAVRRRL